MYLVKSNYLGEQSEKRCFCSKVATRRVFDLMSRVIPAVCIDVEIFNS